MPHAAIRVANELLRDHPNVDHMKLQKLLYYANGWWLATHGEPLLTEYPQVWRYGPVFRQLYSTLSRFGHSNIGGPVAVGIFGGGNQPNLDEAEDAKEIRDLLHAIWEEHGHKSAIQLSNETHGVGTPWRTIAERHNFSVPVNTPIPPQEDWAYFARLAREREIPTTPLRA